MQQVKEDRPSYVRFEKRPIEDRKQSIENGRFTTVDVDFAVITPHGTSDEIPRKVDDWFTYLDLQLRNHRVPAKFVDYYKECYAAWQKGDEAPLKGTPIKEWPPLSPSQIQNCLACRVYTVEDLAGANEDTIRQMGMGSRELKTKAENWLRSASDQGKLAEELTTLQIDNKRLAATAERQEQTISELKRDLKRLLNEQVTKSVEPETE